MPSKLFDLPKLMTYVKSSIEYGVIVGCFYDCADGSNIGCRYTSNMCYYEFDNFNECFDDLSQGLYQWYVDVCKEDIKIFKRECNIENNVLWLLEGGDQDIAIIFQSHILAKKFYQRLKSIILSDNNQNFN